MSENVAGRATSRDAVGLIGVGLMGMALARRLLAAGIPVVGFDLDAAKRVELVAIGGQAVEQLRDLARHCRHVIVAVFSADQANDALAALAGAPSGAGPERALISVVTCDPDDAVALAQRARSVGFGFVEAPISGTSDQVLRGEGVGLIGGSPPADPALTAILDVLLPRRFNVGNIGDGARTKLAVNLILGLNRLALAEGLAFAERMGLDLAAFFDVARGSAAYSQVMDTKGGKMISGDFAPQGRVTQSLKDVHLMLAQAARLGQELPLCRINAAVLESCVRNGEGERDSTIVIEELRRRRSSHGLAPKSAPR